MAWHQTWPAQMSIKLEKTVISHQHRIDWCGFLNFRRKGVHPRGKLQKMKMGMSENGVTLNHQMSIETNWDGIFSGYSSIFCPLSQHLRLGQLATNKLHLCWTWLKHPEESWIQVAAEIGQASPISVWRCLLMIDALASQSLVILCDSMFNWCFPKINHENVGHVACALPSMSPCLPEILIAHCWHRWTWWCASWSSVVCLKGAWEIEDTPSGNVVPFEEPNMMKNMLSTYTFCLNPKG